jgi:hypothetical protein
MFRTWLIVGGLAVALSIGLCAGLGALVFVGVYRMTQPLVEASDEFLESLGQGKTAQAYASAASALRSSQNQPSFTAAAKHLGLTDYSSVTWHSRTRVNDEGTVEGTVVTKSGASWPVTIRLVREGGKWKVASVRYRGIELDEVPTGATLRRMATETLLALDQAVESRDFTAFHARSSALLQRDKAPQQLQQASQQFIDKDIRLGVVKYVQPLLGPPAPGNEQGVLVVEGRYPTRPSEIRFALRYVRESGDWKLLGIRVKVAEPK